MRRAWILLLLAACSPSPPDPPASTSPPVATPKAAAVRIERMNDVRESNGVALGMVGGAARAFVADEDDGAIVEIDLIEQKVVRASPMGARVRDVLVLSDGRLAATLPEVGAVAVLTRDVTGAITEDTRIRPGEEPLALALDREDHRLFVTTGASHSLVELDASTFAEKARWSLGREPRAALVASDGHVIVTHASETFASVLDSEGKIAERDIGNRVLCRGGDCSGRRFARVVHDVGTGGAFLTPTLSGIGTRGRLMHDGRYRSLDELLVSSTAMGKGSTLSVEDRRALVRYLATL